MERAEPVTGGERTDVYNPYGLAWIAGLLLMSVVCWRRSHISKFIFRQLPTGLSGLLS